MGKLKINDGALTMVDIREATPQDQAVLEEMLFQSLFIPPGKPPFRRDILRNPDIAKYVKDWGKASDLAFIAIDKVTGTPVGASWLRLLTAAQKGYGYVDDETPELGIALMSEYRGQGIGTRLLESLLEAAANTYRAVSLSVSKGNQAFNLYQRLGFMTVAEDDDSLTMLKRFGEHQKM